MIVYVLTNPAIPGLVKIGQTGQEDANIRIAQLYTTGVPVPFHLEYACRVDNAIDVEKALHIAFGPQRINPKREFFRLDPEQVIAILKLLETTDATREIASQSTTIDAQSEQAAETLRSRRPNFNFTEMGIPIGAILQSSEDNSTAQVIGPRKVRYQEQEMTLTAATRLMLNLDYSVQPGPRWSYNGKSLSEIYNETYPEE